MSELNVVAVTALRADLWLGGYRPIPVFNITHRATSPGKQPLGAKWQLDARMNPPFCARSPAVAHALNTGILADGLRALDFDIDDPETASECRALAGEMLGAAPTRIRYGSPRALVLYRSAEGEPGKRTLTGRSHTETHACKIEVLGKGQQFVAFGLHPSGADLTWYPGPPGAGEPRDGLIAITEAQISDFLAACALVMDAPVSGAGNSGNGYDNGRGHTSTPPPAPDAGTLPNSVRALIEQIQTAPGGWHEDVLRLTAILVGRGVPRTAILCMAAELTRSDRKKPSGEPYTVADTKAAMSKMLDGAYDKGYGVGDDEADVAADVPDDVSDVEADVMDVPPEPASVTRAPIQILSEDDLEAMPDPVFLIDDLLVADSLCVLYGAWASFKSFIALHIALCLVTGMPFFGMEVVQSDVLYIAGEGAAGIKKRLAAWKKHHGVARTPGFRVVAVAINLLDRSEAERLITAVLEKQRADGFNPKLVIVDTLHRAMPGGDENAAKEMGIVLANGAHIQLRLGCMLMPIHHSGKEFDRGMRGSSGLPGGADTILRMTRNGTSERGALQIEKQKDGEDGREFHVISQVVDLPPSPGSLKPRSSLVLTSTGTPSASGPSGQPKQPKLYGKAAALGLRVLWDTTIAEGKPLPTTDGFPSTAMRGVTEQAWRREFYRRLTDSEPEAKRKAFNRMVEALQATARIGICDGWVWTVYQDAM